MPEFKDAGLAKLKKLNQTKGTKWIQTGGNFLDMYTFHPVCWLNPFDSNLLNPFNSASNFNMLSSIYGQWQNLFKKHPRRLSEHRFDLNYDTLSFGYNIISHCNKCEIQLQSIRVQDAKKQVPYQRADSSLLIKLRDSIWLVI